eukprot:CAMPEP_0185255978 /NCGR_PEP_ID=MMETSP1359-20130426/5039_1 /TAXON_ID=552665 /ORGANISM="Bigelowiella longifila, Strain CCMP242" /LENGTH=158 /DNA_ID=CAMNT_0027840247 /DNA_START=50 /DNA_END=523 /DNA_ORIENTATION=+
MATLVVGGIAAVAAFGYYIYRGRARKDPLQGGLIGEDQAGGPNGEGDPQDGVADANRRTGRAKIGKRNEVVGSGEAVEVNMDNKGRQGDSDNLPEGWSRHTHPETGKMYYYHQASGQSSWSFPKDQEKEIQLPAGWTKHYDAEGTPYYYNSTTGESEW